MCLPVIHADVSAKNNKKNKDRATNSRAGTYFSEHATTMPGQGWVGRGKPQSHMSGMEERGKAMSCQSMGKERESYRTGILIQWKEEERQPHQSKW